MKTAEPQAPRSGTHHDAAHNTTPVDERRSSNRRLTWLVVVLTLPVLVIGLVVSEALFALIVRVL